MNNTDKDLNSSSDCLADVAEPSDGNRTTLKTLEDAKGENMWKTSAPTVRLDEMRMSRADFDLDAFHAQIWQKCLDACIKRVKKSLEKNDGWFKIVGGGWYFSGINAVMNELFMAGTHWSVWPVFDEGRTFPLSGKPEALDGVIPTVRELKTILNSEKCPYPHNGTSDKYLVRDCTNCGQCAAARVSTQPLAAGQPLEDQIFANRETMLVAGGIGCRWYAKTVLSVDTPGFTASILPIYRLDQACHGASYATNPLTPIELLVLWSLYDVTPICLQNDDDFALLKGLIRNQSSALAIEAGELRIVSPVKPEIDAYETMLRDEMVDRLLMCDEVRADIKPRYSEKILSSPDTSYGHWDLWAENSGATGKEDVTVPMVCYARNPRCDVKSDGVIGIDFGTKNTTVVRKVDKEPSKPMRVGHANFEELPTESSDYENPTVMQFVDFDAFCGAYARHIGRPLTNWLDLTISHTAAKALRDAQEGASDVYTSFLYELKQWAGGNGTLRIFDLKGREYILPPYGTLTGKEFPDPIEIYAYYLGLNINHMRNGVYLRYELSYPVTYDKDILERLRASFERGIRKSLPPSILNDEELMKDFYVRFGASEPAAYSLCALEEYGFKPSGKDQRFFYGVFDFGGGTTDFDYGIYRDVNDAEADEGFDYVLEHFRPSGDKYLGGENILQLLAFEVFKSNKEELLKKRIMFPRPAERDNTSFEGEEGLVADTPEAKINMMQVMEALRPLWETQVGPNSLEDSDGEENSPMSENGKKTSVNPRAQEKFQDYRNCIEKINGGKISVTLFNCEGDQQTDVELVVDKTQLQAKIKERIRKGVINFFIRMKEAFKEPIVPKELEKVSIFLAGNSCKSPMVMELFEEQLKAFDEENDAYAGKFEIFPPLGSDGALKKMGELDVPTRAGIEQPTGKTGVAFGLVMGREGGSVKVIDRNKDESGAIHFRFYVGKKRKGVFVPILMSDSKPNKWEKVLCVGDRKTVEIHYSDLAEAGTGLLPVEKTFTKSCHVEQPRQKDASLFICVKSANEFAWVVAKDDTSISTENVRVFRLD